MLTSELQSGETIRRDGRFVTGVPHDPERKLEIVRLVLHYEDLRHAALPIRLGARRAAGPV